MKTHPVDKMSRDAARDLRERLDAEVLTQPSLIKTDGTGLTYACDVKIVGQEKILRSVPIALGNREVEYAEVGSAVTVKRNEGSGTFEIIGFSKTKPGTRTIVPVDLDAITADDAVDDTLSSRRLTYAEIATLGGGYGTCPYGAVGIFRGTTLLEVKA